uniref:Uncharacterized protein n=1 Tax=Sciurus vulgaris TaxID=55149 RepID=A0A8D2AJZ7_SCIVU
MEKDPATHRRHRPGPGALTSGVAPGHLKAASDGAELQRSRSMGGLHQKGDPPSRIRKLRRGPESEDQGQDPRRDADDTICQVNPEEDRKEKTQDALGGLDQECGKTESEVEKSDSEASTKEEQAGACAGSCALEAEEQKLESMKLNSLLEKEKPSAFVEIDLGDHAEEVQTKCACRPGRHHTTPLLASRTRTSWVCCIPYPTKRKAKGCTATLEKVLSARGGAGGRARVVTPPVPAQVPSDQVPRESLGIGQS